MAIIFFYRNSEDGIEWTSFMEAWERSWGISRGEDMTEWLLSEDDDKWKFILLIWSLLAFFVFTNIMIAMSGSVFAETREGWLHGDLEVKNELILQTEMLFVWRRNWASCNKNANSTKHLLLIEVD
jgi:hypothetical protein